MRFNGTNLLMIFSVITFCAQYVLAESDLEATPISEWNYDALYKKAGFTANNLMDAAVLGSENQRIGEVENVLLSEENRILAVIAQVGDIWKASDTHLLIPWEEIDVKREGLATSISEQNIEGYGLFESQYLTRQDLESTKEVEDKVSMSPNVWKLSDIMNQFTNVNEGYGYGYVDDVLFSTEGMVQALVIDAQRNGGSETYAFPFTGIGEGWAPGIYSYTLPYSESELLDVPVFEYEKYDGLWS